MSNTVERGQLPIARSHTSNSVATLDVLAAADRPAGSSSPTLNSAEQPRNPLQIWLQSQPWNFVKRLNQTGHNGWLVTTLVLIMVVTMSLSFGFVRGWVDA